MDLTGYGRASSMSGSDNPNLPPRPKTLGPGGDIPIKLTPITGRVSRIKKGVPVHTCDICKPPKTFTRAEHLRRHQLSHQTPQYPCQHLGCDRAFHRPDLLARHMQRHDQEGEHLATASHGASRRSSPDIVAPTQRGLHVVGGTTPGLALGHFNAPPPPWAPSAVGDEAVEMDLITDSGYSSNLPAFVSDSKIPSILGGALMRSNAEPDIQLSDTLSIHNSKLSACISEFAEELRAVLPSTIALDQLRSLWSALPLLLKSFAVKIGQDPPSEIHLKLVHMVFKYREQIARAVIFKYTAEDDIIDDLEPRRGYTMPIEDKMSLWQSKDGTQETEEQVDTAWDVEPNEADDLLEFQAYRDILLRSPSYEWLVNSVLRQMNFKLSGIYNAQVQIREEILLRLGEPTQLSRKMPPKTHSITFTLQGIEEFLTSQEYDVSNSEALKKVIVLTGSEQNAWATTCEQYVKSVWPEFGPTILRDLTSLLAKQPPQYIHSVLFDNTRLTSTRKAAPTGSIPRIYEISATGSAYSLAELGELFSWLQTALSTPEMEERVFCALPRIGSGFPVHGTFSSRATFFEYGFGNKIIGSIPGTCWTDLFGRPSTVGGFPVPRRSQYDNGVEMSLGIMTELVGTRRISRSSGKILIKGYSTALVATRQFDDLVLWHMAFNRDGTYLSYTDFRVKKLLAEQPAGLTSNSIQSARHILGWSRETETLVGSPNANYNIKWSGLKRPQAGCAFEKVSIVGGMFITAGVSCVVGKRDKAVHIRYRQDYIMRLKWISKKLVLLYDVADKRGWLVDGISALLHLLRASLKHDQNDDFASHFGFRDSDLQEAPAGLTAKAAAINMLTNPHNMGLSLYAKPDTSREEIHTDDHPRGMSQQTTTTTTVTKTSYRLQDRVDALCDVLEQLLAHQADEACADGVGFRVRASARRTLEGFDFMDVATDEDPLWPRAVTLTTGGRGWVDLARAVHAVTLFGAGFGNLIRPGPASATVAPGDLGDTGGKGKGIEMGFGSSGGPMPVVCGACGAGADVPRGRDYLATSVATLEAIMDRHGSTATRPWRLVDELYWHTPDKAFEPCRCSTIGDTSITGSSSSTGSSASRHDRVQVLLPASFPKLWGRGLRSPETALGQVPRGGVLFGHSWRFPLRWRDRGPPEEGDPALLEHEEMEQLGADLSASTLLAGTTSAGSATSVEGGGGADSQEEEGDEF